MKNSNTKRILDSIKKELSQILQNKTFDNQPSVDNPYEFENEMYKFRYVGNNNLYIQPKNGVEYLVLNIKISLTE